MLKRSQIIQIKLLAAKRVSQRAIAAVVGCSRGAVANVLAGKRDFLLGLEDAREEIPKMKRSPGAPEADYVRCKDCGRRVILPCLACRIERLRLARRPSKAA